MLRLYLIRHGQSTNNIQPNFAKHVFEPPLTEHGIKQSMTLATHLKYGSDNGALGYGYNIQQIYTSPQLRSLQTVEPIARQLNISPEIWIKLHERGGVVILHPKGVQHHHGLTYNEIETQFPTCKIPCKITDKGWWEGTDTLESNDEVIARAKIIAKRLISKALPSQDLGIAVVSHATFLNFLGQVLLKDTENRFMHHNAGLSRIDIDSNHNATLKYLDRTSYLDQTWIS
jgi:broad specificity phosphatase PhoE